MSEKMNKTRTKDPRLKPVPLVGALGFGRVWVTAFWKMIPMF